MQDAVAEFDTLVVPDKRLAQRVRSFVECAWRDPSASLPDMLQDVARLEGAYRLLNNRRITSPVLHGPHQRQTVERAREVGCVVVVHDTTDVETPYADASEVGYLRTGRTGYRAHVSLALAVEPCRPARPLGVLGVQADFQPEPPQSRGTKKKPPKRQAMVHSKDKAYLRWERGVQASAESLEGCDSVVHVADREADSYALFCTVIQLGHEFVFRIRNDRRARVEDDLLPPEWSLLSEIASGMQGAFECMVPLSKRGDKGIVARAKTHPPREARCARLQYSALPIELRRPHNLPAELPETLSLTLVRAWEPSPPSGEKPVEWLLLTTETCQTDAAIMRVVGLYRSRWMIEEFFKALKTGCSLQERQFESKHALLNVLAVFLPIAVHLLWLRTCARDTPDLPAAEVFTPLQLTVLRHRSHRKMPENPTVLEALWVLAGIGGHIPNNGWPGWQVLGRAFVKFCDAVVVWQMARAAAEM